MNQLPRPKSFGRELQYFLCRRICDEEHYKRLTASEKTKGKNKKDTERKVLRAVIDTINGSEMYTKSTAVKSLTDAICSHMGLTYRKSTEVKSITDAICSHMGLTVKWSDAKGGHNRPDDMAESASKKLCLGEEGPAVGSVVNDEGDGVHEGMQPTQPTATPDVNVSTVYSVSLATQCFNRAYLSTGATQSNLRCGSKNLSETFSPE